MKEGHDVSPIKQNLPRLDAATDIVIHVRAADAAGAVADDPAKCALARAMNHAGFEALVMNEVVIVEAPADAEVIRHNRRRGNGNVSGVQVGDMIHYRYRLGKATRAERRTFDENGGFAEGYYKLRAPSEGFRLHRDKRSATRRERRDAHKEGVEPAYTRQVRLLRAAKASQILRGGQND